MPAEFGADFRNEMEALRREYLAELAGRAGSLAAAARALAGLSGHNVRLPDLGELRAAVHRLAGSAGIYGFPGIGEKARAVDELLLGVLQGGQPLDGPAVASRLSELVRALQDAIRGSGSARSGEEPEPAPDGREPQSGGG